MKYWLSIIGCTLLLLLAIFTAGYTNSKVTLGPLENTKGIPYPHHQNATVITEQLTHVDLYLNQPALANTAVVNLDFDPQNLASLTLGIRDNAFWLSYTKIPIYQQGTDPLGRQHRTVSIPLTDKLQESDRSLDLMLFATPQNSTNIDPIDAGPSDTTLWYLHDLRVDIHKTVPTFSQFKDYLKSIIYRERAL